MRSFVLRHGVIVGIALLLLGTSFFYLVSFLTRDPLAGLTLATVETGIVESIVSVSGVTRSRNTAELAFPTSGVVAAVPVKEGDRVEAGTILATLGSAREVANLDKARADLAIAEANLESLIRGVRPEARAVTSASVEAARAEVERVTKETNQAVDNARRALYSNSLATESNNPFESSPAPVITGTYRCTEPGVYTLRVYNSGAVSGYSLGLTGLETGTYSVGIDQPAPFGNCGLQAQFADNETYHNTTWQIEIPNTRSSTYITLKNALDLALTNRDNAIAAANEALRLAEKKQSLENANPLTTDIKTAEARVAQARAALTEIGATLREHSIVAPFAGQVTAVDILPGETAPTTPVITLLAADAFEVVARVPEIDITKIALDQTARVVFDAKADEMKTGRVSYISPLPTTIDGVAYFEVKIGFAEMPAWLRGGLNADIDIVTGASSDTSKIPTRYLITNDTGTYVRTLAGTTIATTTIEVLFNGNDGYVSIRGLAPGTTIIAP
jgi:HlyD family secretion protein